MPDASTQPVDHLPREAIALPLDLALMGIDGLRRDLLKIEHLLGHTWCLGLVAQCDDIEQSLQVVQSHLGLQQPTA